MSEKLLLLDGSSYLYRAFYAMPDLRNSRGEPTGAIYGVINMLRKLLSDQDTNYVACVFDSSEKTFRKDIFSSYKANRSSMPDDLVKQTEYIYKIIEALGLPIYHSNSFEADDIIGSIVTKILEISDFNVVISSGDKDLSQLVNKRVSIINTMSNDILDEEGVARKFGIPPNLIVDYLMLIGDSVDNVPGVKKIGPKTAVKLLNKYGSLNNIISNIDEIPGLIGKNLRDFIDKFEITRKLLTIKCDCDLGDRINSKEDFLIKPMIYNELINLYTRFDFNLWLDEIKDEYYYSNHVNDRELFIDNLLRDVEIVDSIDYLYSFLECLNNPGVVSVDFIFTSTVPMLSKLVAISCFSNKRLFYIPMLDHKPDNLYLQKNYILSLLKPWIEDSTKQKIVHNAKNCFHVLYNEGIELKGVRDDVMLQAYVLDSHNNISIDKLSEKYLQIKHNSYKEIYGKCKEIDDFSDFDIIASANYSAKNSLIIMELCIEFSKLLEKDSLNSIYDLEMKISNILSIIEINGVEIDSNKLKDHSLNLSDKISKLESEVFNIVGKSFNLNSPKQLGDILFGLMKYPLVKKTSAGLHSTDESVLRKLSNDFLLPNIILEYRSLTKLKSTYTDKLPSMVNINTGRLHTTYSQIGVITGRLSSSYPNLQNIPVRTDLGRMIRQAFVSREDYLLISADYSQIELRVMAHISDDTNLKISFSEGKDIHSATASEIFDTDICNVSHEQRRSAKAINFGLLYGMSVFGLSSALKISRSSAKQYMDRYFFRYPLVAVYMEDICKKAKKYGYVETIFGRRIYTPEIHGSSINNRQSSERAAMNAPIQGTAADIMKMAMISVHNWLVKNNMKTRIVMQVHDELIFEAHETEVQILKDVLPSLMCDIVNISVPLVIEIGTGKNWSQAH
ncbi:DNA polymerase I [Candidatus Kinetoplastibacterium blastocrithidii TCC012E]|uniref:DNA polymerase I n=1 Tax=Candidatus Kinetoplastidibacterium blastocrithidiae TCC012E TaxID=1208922 RepID=M1M3Z9_9PROT|nr:DNA polymerase I [Candidatus Kinetoplastibacterium blastocrithidii]AFZ83712.1 DNA polymerase I [Candidatus Kinetoplastibacterium blastocrithidii (ex Strigomonas culicis)]AGF49834.1 DNA polymerase I [Candidatus Kinetoplastibacterium blastocrithidii TCC012E]